MLNNEMKQQGDSNSETNGTRHICPFCAISIREKIVRYSTTLEYDDGLDFLTKTSDIALNVLLGLFNAIKRDIASFEHLNHGGRSLSILQNYPHLCKMVKENARINLTGKANSPSEELHIKEQNPLSPIGRFDVATQTCRSDERISNTIGIQTEEDYANKRLESGDVISAKNLFNTFGNDDSGNSLPAFVQKTFENSLISHPTAASASHPDYSISTNSNSNNSIGQISFQNVALMVARSHCSILELNSDGSLANYVERDKVKQERKRGQFFVKETLVSSASDSNSLTKINQELI